MKQRTIAATARNVSYGAVAGLMGCLLLVSAIPVRAAGTGGTPPGARVSFTFDDGLASAATQAQPTLTKYGLTGTDYVISGCVGMTVTPNTCRANTDRSYMTWSQIQALSSTYGWEIGSHTVDHKCLASNAQQDPGDCQVASLTQAQIDTELNQSQAALAAHGITASDFAPPYGDYNLTVLTEIAKYYASMRQFRNSSNNTNTWPYSDYYLWDYVVQEGLTPVSTVETAIDQAIANNQWLILTFHDIAASPSQNADDYQYGTSELDQIAAYVKSKQTTGTLQPVTISQGLAPNGTNLMPNGTFDSGIAGGWTTDAPSTITADSATNGSYPSPTNAIKMVSASATGHLFSPKISVTPGTTYLLKNFLNVKAISSGQVGFYVDEYDANGNWISGQWLNQERSAFVESMNFSYTPSSPSVSKASLQVIVSANAGITAYLDNAQWYPVVSTAPVNLVANGTFDSGIAGGWTTDNPTNITADGNNNGSPANPMNSVKLLSSTTTANGHLFSPLVSVSSTKTYTINSWLNLQQLTNTTSGEVGFYIDEFNANNAWVSGQYKTGVHTMGSGNVGFTYTPSSSQVANARLQVIVVGNAGIQAYFDNVSWTSN
jgi:peptidoglycan/xylan/chitin deacetylase (PgdA/CDA1 family)